MIREHLLGHEGRREHGEVAERAIAGIPETSARSGSRTARRIACTGGSRVSMKMLPPRRPTLLVSVSRTRMR